MPVIDTSALGYPLVSDIMLLARSHVNDTQPGLLDVPGEGQILTNDPLLSPFTLPFINSAIRTLHRDLELSGAPTVIRDNVIVSGLTPVNGPQGIGIPDSDIQTSLSYVGYDDGTTVNTLVVLPADVLAVEAISERQSGTGGLFIPMREVQAGISSRLQSSTLGVWETRGDAIYFPGALTPRDIRLRYYAVLPIVDPNSDFTQTSVTILDSCDALAYMIAALYSAARGGLGAGTLEAKATTEVTKIKAREIRRAQSVTYHRPAFRRGV
jgi:hypothetical protein